MLGATEYVDDVHLLARPKYLVQVIQVRDRTLTQHSARCRRDRDDPVAKALQRTCHPVARARGIRGKADDGNRPGGVQ